MVKYTGLREISRSILERDKALRSYRNMKECILKLILKDEVDNRHYVYHCFDPELGLRYP